MEKKTGLHTSHRKQKHHAFSLVEIAIILAIVGFTAAGVVGGKTLIDNQRLNHIIDDTARIHEAVAQFEKTYGGKPGDLWNATQKLGAGALNGNGNGIIDNFAGNTNQERYAFWQHLALAGLIEGNYTGTGPTPNPGVNVMKTARPELYYWVDTDNVSADGGSPYIITLRRVNAGTDTAAISPEDAYKLDKKYDDGLPDSGKIIVQTGSGPGGADCVTSTGYNVDNDAAGCEIIFRLTDDKIAETITTAPAVTCPGNAVPDTAEKLGECPPGQTGEWFRTCGADGIWVTTNTCSGTTTCSLGETNHIPCPSGEIGAGTDLSCNSSGVWITTAYNCAPITCPSSDGIVYHPGDMNHATCPAGQTGGVDTCQEDGTWQITTPCTPITCPGGAFPTNTRPISCPAGQIGGTEICTAAGTWAPNTACIPITCPGGQTPGKTRDATCPEGEEGGVQTCQADGTWSTIVTGCTPSKPSGKKGRGGCPHSESSSGGTYSAITIYMPPGSLREKPTNNACTDSNGNQGKWMQICDINSKWVNSFCYVASTTP